MKTGKGPYMQKPGRGNMEKTAANPRMGSLMYGGPHQGGTTTDPAKDLERPGNRYQPKYKANVMGEATEIIPAGPIEDPKTGQELPLIYRSAHVANERPGSEVTTRRITPESQNIARNRTNTPVLNQSTTADGKMVRAASTNQLKTDFSDYSQGRHSFLNATRNAGQNVNNINQAALASKIAAARKSGNWNSGGLAAMELQDMIYDIHRGDSTDVANYNIISKSNRKLEADRPTVQTLSPNMRKKK